MPGLSTGTPPPSNSPVVVDTSIPDFQSRSRAQKPEAQLHILPEIERVEKNEAPNCYHQDRHHGGLLPGLRIGRRHLANRHRHLLRQGDLRFQVSGGLTGNV